MSAFTAPITRREGRSFGRATHWYVDANGLKIPGVTSILSDGFPKPALVGWGIKSVAEYAIDHWDDLAVEKPSDRLKTLKGSPYADRDAAANRGSAVHALAEQLVQGVEVDVPDELAGHVEAYVRFLTEWAPEPVLVERTVVNYTVGYAGTLDLSARFPCWPGEHVLTDIKTSRSGIFGETGMQLAAYRFAEFFVDDDGTEQPMPAIDRVIAVHVRADGYDVIPVRADEYVFTRFRHVAVVARAAGEARSWVGDALTPPRLEESA